MTKGRMRSGRITFGRCFVWHTFGKQKDTGDFMKKVPYTRDG